MPDHPENLPPPDTRFPERYSDATGKGDIHISGAGTIGMAILIVSLSILFIASMAASIIIRVQYQSQPGHSWPPLGMPRLPASLWLSTAVILVSSITIQKAVSAARRDDDKSLRRNLIATFVIGVLFLLMQTANWLEFYQAIRNTAFQGSYLGMFFILTGLHAAHVIGGLVPLGVIIIRAKQGRYSRNFHPGVRYSAIYWHFLDAVWCVLFLLIYF